MRITEAMIKKICSATIYKRGLEYFNEGRVHLRKREENLITAVVDGEELYNVNVKLTDDGIADCFCTCPYFETMNTACKHIVAALMQRRKELEQGAEFVDENDRIAKRLCDDFLAKKHKRDKLRAKFTLHITRLQSGGAEYGMSMTVNGVRVQGIENFLESCITGEEFKFDRYTKYNPRDYEFPKYQNEIIKILAEAYESSALQTRLYMKAAYRTTFGQLTAKRIFPLLAYVDFTLIFDSMTLGMVRIAEENPDIIIDVNAMDGEINMSVSDRGFALTRDGEWFLYENTIYHTDEKWRSYFMPIYNSLNAQSRTQISFKGDNSVLFATHVLPEIKDKHGVITKGIDELIISEKPVFDIYFDTLGNAVTAAVIVNYGDLAIRLPSESHTDGRIIVRDKEAENNVMSSFGNFVINNGTLSLYSDRDIYLFLSDEIPRLEKLADLHLSDRFKGLKISDNIDIRASVSYMTHIDLLETGFESNLTYEQINGILNAVKLKKSFYRMPGGSFINLEGSAQKDTLNLLNQLDFTYEDLRNGSKTVPKYHALYLNSLASVRKNDSFIKYINEIKNKKPVIPKGLENVLRGYQKEGMEWLTQLSCLGFGGILADDMGLGKTLQIIAYIHGARPGKPSLIVAPRARLKQAP